MVKDNADEAAGMQYFQALVKSLIQLLPVELTMCASAIGNFAADQLCKLFSWCRYHSAVKWHQLSPQIPRFSIYGIPASL